MQIRDIDREIVSNQHPKGLQDGKAPWIESSPLAYRYRNFNFNKTLELSGLKNLTCESTQQKKKCTEIQNQLIHSNKIYNCQMDEIFGWYCQSHSQFVSYTQMSNYFKTIQRAEHQNKRNRLSKYLRASDTDSLVHPSLHLRFWVCQFKFAPQGTPPWGHLNI